jgi:hypothetical protein
MWTIGYKAGEQGVGEINVDVEECSPQEHYLYLYNVEERLESKDAEGEEDSSNVQDIKANKQAHVRGYFNPAAWLYAIHGSVRLENLAIANEAGAE